MTKCRVDTSVLSLRHTKQAIWSFGLPYGLFFTTQARGVRRKEAERGFGFGVVSFVRTGKWDMGINPATAGLIFGARDVIVRRQGQPGARRDPDARSAPLSSGRESSRRRARAS